MNDTAPVMKPIWYFVGLILLAMGVVILATGMWELAFPPEVQPVLAALRANLWWGGIMIAAGLLFLFLNRGTKQR
ncbi:MAG: hypothetical protein A2284_17925 [Deltaproteobacteria bacterium RIFOXYA12_FULL_61_11]|nr:MAG: hypothetical protein A2284_17925 [Deltaproteobacteria bacterium RIFOXYA12_FULL_61_11]